MRPQDVNRKLFHRGHYEILAKQFREQLKSYSGDSDIISACRGALIDLALSMAQRFCADNEDFDPVFWLDRCSPDSESYPLSELWEGVVIDV